LIALSGFSDIILNASPRFCLESDLVPKPDKPCFSIISGNLTGCLLVKKQRHNPIFKHIYKCGKIHITIMPARSEKQKRFFYLVKATQQGKVSPKQVGSKVAKAAKTMSAQDVDDFTRGKNLPSKKIKEIIECLKGLKTDPRVDLRYDITGAGSGGQKPIEPMYLESRDDVKFDTTGKPIDPHYVEEDSTLPPENLGRKGVAVAGSNYLYEDGDDDINVNPIAKTFKQQGNFEQYIQRFSGLELKPKEIESIINYINAKPTKMDKFSVRYEGTDDFNNNTITVIKKLREGNDLVFTVFQVTTQQTPESGKEATPTENEIIVNKSRAFRDEIEGGKILADLLQKLKI
jgi:hypothetical protein